MSDYLCCGNCGSVIADPKTFGLILKKKRHVYINPKQVNLTVLLSSKEGTLKCSKCKKKVGSKKRSNLMGMSYFASDKGTKIMQKDSNKWQATKEWKKKVPSQYILRANAKGKKRNNQKFGEGGKKIVEPNKGSKTVETNKGFREKRNRSRKKKKKLKNYHQMNDHINRLVSNTKIELVDILELEVFTQIIGATDLNLQVSQNVLKLLCEKDFAESMLSIRVEMVFKKVLDSEFMKSSFPRFIMYGVLCKEDVKLVMQFYKYLVKFCNDMFYHIELRPLQSLLKKNEYVDDDVIREFEELQNKLKQIEIQYQANLLSQDKKVPVEELGEFSIRSSQDHPALKELINRPKRGVLPKNKEKWNSFEEYVSTHYKLLREDFIEPLRSGLNEYLKPGRKGRTLKVHSGVKVQKIGINKYTKDFFFAVNLKQKSSRYNSLKYGTLVCLFKSSEFTKEILIDEERDVGYILAIVLSSIHKQEQKANNLMISPIHNTVVNIRETFVLIESPSYYKSVAPVLSCLRRLDKDNFPFHDVLIECSTEIRPPDYLKKYPRVDISGILEGGLKKILNVQEKSIPKQVSRLYDSQCDALDNILTNRVALVKGPPGTGKSFVGIEATKILLTHLETYSIRNPIIAICYTNHALDQFLMGLKDFTSRLIRIGGRSREPELEPYNFNTKLKGLRCGGNIRKIDKDIYTLRDLVESEFDMLDEFNIVRKYLSGFRSKFMRDWNKNLTPVKIFDLWKQGNEKGVVRKFREKEKKKLKKNPNENSFGAFKTPPSEEKKTKDYGFISVKRYKPTHTEELLSSDSEDEDIYDYDKEVVYEEEMDLIELEGLDYYMDTLEIDDDSSDDEIETKKSPKFNSYIKKLNSISKDVWKIKLKGRKKIVHNLTESHYEWVHSALDTINARLEKLKKEKNELLDEAKAKILQGASIIGLTSTGAALNHNILKNLNTPVYIFEEAAELLECQVTSLLNEKVQHLILIGDEQQLRPKLNSYQLKLYHGFDISLFERLILNNMKKVTLTVQRRMRPAISSLMRIFYKNIKDHPSVSEYPDISGVNENVYFLSHNRTETENGGSKSNLPEAVFVSHFTQYLCCQKEYGPEDITIITPYSGQKNIIQKMIGKKKLKVRVVTIDDFQGEENKIIILSLVRSNANNNMGFVAITNRIIVSLSRAKFGLYIIGNSELLGNSDDWYKVVQHFKRKKLISAKLTLQCMKHKNHLASVSVGDGKIEELLHGGCSTPCDFHFSCGHSCGHKCHPQSHKRIKCRKKCLKVNRLCHHSCQRICHENNPACGKCMAKVVYTLPKCGHKVSHLKCSDDKTTLICEAKCQKVQLGCMHKCQSSCKDCSLHRGYKNACLPCIVKVKKKCTKCKKNFLGACSSNVCTNRCTTRLECGHSCCGKCGICSIGGTHSACEKDCKRKLLCGHFCGKHNCKDPCPPCVQKCVFRCDHSKCRHPCDKNCFRCREKCSSRCRHSSCKKLCYQICDRKPCNKPCVVILKCQHQCSGLCGEVCPSVCLKCDSSLKKEERWKDIISLMDSKEYMEDVDPEAPTMLYTLKCGHTFEVDGLDAYVKMELKKSAIGLLGCMVCKRPLVNERRYKNIIWNMRKVVINIKLKMIWEKEKMGRDLAIKAVQGDLRAGHWFKCPNGHPYFIGECGGAMEVGKCPDCAEIIGGSHHTLVKTNTLAGDIDGAIEPLWREEFNY